MLLDNKCNKCENINKLRSVECIECCKHLTPFTDIPYNYTPRKEDNNAIRDTANKF